MNKRSQGISLFEVLLAVAIFGVGIGSIAHLYLGSHYASLYSIEKNKALLFAKEGIEAVRSIKDENFLDVRRMIMLGGVTINKTTGVFSGYAWADNLGWINFGPTGPYPTPPNNSVTLNTGTGAVTGWARVLSNNEWILLQNVTITNNVFHGWAWGDQTLGWASFNCLNQNQCGTSDYKVSVIVNSPEFNYNSTTGWAWSDNIGWINFPFVDPVRGVIIQSSRWALTGQAETYEKFTRQISIEEINPETRRVTSTVSWRTARGDETSVSLSEYLTAWREPFLIRYNLNISSGLGGSVTLPGTGVHTYVHGEVVPLQATPNAGQVFVGWTGDTGTIANVNSTNTTITINGHYNIAANFQAAP